MGNPDKDYYLRREAAELRLAGISIEPSVRAVHETLAREYRRRAAKDFDSIAVHA